MFGSNDDKKTPAEPGEKKGLFGWLRKKPQQPVAEPPAAEPQEDSLPHAEQPEAEIEQPAIDAPDVLPERPVEAEIFPEPEPEP
ncbi:signal recognition particle-docking protein FtsY, partial [Stutzerimonas xanthomarina]